MKFNIFKKIGSFLLALALIASVLPWNAHAATPAWTHMSDVEAAMNMAAYDAATGKMTLKNDPGFAARMQYTGLADTAGKDWTIEFDMVTAGGAIGVYQYDASGALYGAYLDTNGAALDSIRYEGSTCKDGFFFFEGKSPEATAPGWTLADKTKSHIRVDFVRGAGGTMAGGMVTYYKKNLTTGQYSRLGTLAVSPEMKDDTALPNMFGIHLVLGEATLSNLTVKEYKPINWIHMSDTEAAANKASFDVDTGKMTLKNDAGWASRMQYTGLADAAGKDWSVEFDMVTKGGAIGVYQYDASGAMYGAYLDTNAAQLDSVRFDDWATCKDGFFFFEGKASEGAASGWTAADKTNSHIRVDFVRGPGGTMAGGTVTYYKKNLTTGQYIRLGTLKVSSEVKDNTSMPNMFGIHLVLGEATLSNITIKECKPINWDYMSSTEAAANMVSYDSATDKITFKNDGGWSGRMQNIGVLPVKGKDYAVEFDMNIAGGAIGVYNYEASSGVLYGVYLDAGTGKLDRLQFSNWTTCLDNFWYVEHFGNYATVHPQISCTNWQSVTNKTVRLRVEFLCGANGSLAGGQVDYYRKDTSTGKWLLLGSVPTPTNVADNAALQNYFGIQLRVGTGTVSNITIQEIVPTGTLIVGGSASSTNEIQISVENGKQLPVGYVEDKYIIGWKVDNTPVTKYDDGVESTKYVADFVDLDMLKVRSYDNFNKIGANAAAYDVSLIASVNKKTYKSSGFVYSFSNTAPAIGADGCNTKVAAGYVQNATYGKKTKTVNDLYPGGYSSFMYTSSIPGVAVTGDARQIYVRAYVELEDGTIVYGKAQEIYTPDVIAGKKIAWLGSSVTYGLAADGISMADIIADNHADTTSYKYAVSGTTLVNDSATSYVARMLEISKDLPIDAFVVQLSTNDATTNKPLGQISTSKKLEDFDTKTVAGAIEYIIAYAQKTWNCPVVFYTGTRYDSAAYTKMVELLMAISEKWDIDVIDLWNDAEMTAVLGTEQYGKYMADSVHPTYQGYEEWWTPKFEEYFRKLWRNTISEKEDWEGQENWTHMSSDEKEMGKASYDVSKNEITFLNDPGWAARMQYIGMNDIAGQDWTIEFGLSVDGGAIGVYQYDGSGAMYGAYLDTNAAQLDSVRFDDWTTNKDGFYFFEGKAPEAGALNWDPDTDKPASQLRVDFVRGEGGTMAGGTVTYYKKNADDKYVKIGTLNVPAEMADSAEHRNTFGIHLVLGNGKVINPTIKEYTPIQVEEPDESVWTYVSAYERNQAKVSYNKQKNTLTFKVDDGWSGRMLYTGLTEIENKDYAIEFDVNITGGAVGVFAYEPAGVLYGAYLDTGAGTLDQVHFVNGSNCLDDFHFREKSVEGATVHPVVPVENWGPSYLKNTRIRVEISGKTVTYYRKDAKKDLYYLLGSVEMPSDLKKEHDSQPIYFGAQLWLGEGTISNFTIGERKTVNVYKDPTWVHLSEVEQKKGEARYNASSKVITFSGKCEGWDSRMINTEIKDLSGQNFAVEFNANLGKKGAIGITPYYDDAQHFYSVYYDIAGSRLDGVGINGVKNDKLVVLDDFAYINNNIYPSFPMLAKSATGGENVRFRVECFLGPNGTMAGGKVHFYFMRNGFTEWTRMGVITMPTTIEDDPNLPNRLIIHGRLVNGTVSAIEVQQGIKSPILPFATAESKTWGYVSNYEKLIGGATFDDKTGTMTLAYDGGWASRMVYLPMPDVSGKAFAMEFNAEWAAGGALGVVPFYENANNFYGVFLDRGARMIDGAGHSGGKVIDDFNYADSSHYPANPVQAFPVINWVRYRFEFFPGADGKATGGTCKLFYKTMTEGEIRDEQWRFIGDFTLPETVVDNADKPNKVMIAARLMSATLSDIDFIEITPDTVTEYYNGPEDFGFEDGYAVDDYVAAPVEETNTLPLDSIVMIAAGGVILVATVIYLIVSGKKKKKEE